MKAVSPEARALDAEIAGSSRNLMPLAALWLARSIAVVWIFVSMLKIWSSIEHAIKEPQAIFIPSVQPQPDCARTFPIALLALVALLECFAGWLALTGREARGVLVGVALLSLCTLAMMLWPIPPETPCGCAGREVEMPGSPLSRLALLGGLHAFSLACLSHIRR